MKKFILFIVAAALLAGIGYTGYIIFSSKNISTVEIEGNIQTIYLVDEAKETQKPNFQDAKLKITYKSGDVKYLNMKSNMSKLKIDDFSTSLEDHRTMKITYKSKLMTVDYSVIKSGLYYLSSQVTTSSNGSEIPNSNSNYTINNTKSLYYLDKGGVLKYYSYDLSSNRWYLYDGKYKSEYKYEMVDDRVNIYVGKDAPSYMLQAKVEDGEMTVSSTNYSYEGEFLVSKTVYDFTHYEMKTNVSISSAELVSKNFVNNTQVSSEEYLIFKVGDTIETSKNEVFMKVNYSSPLIYVSTSISSTDAIGLLSSVYVVLDDSMVKSGTLNTNEKRSGISYAEIHYESNVEHLVYVVEY